MRLEFGIVLTTREERQTFALCLSQWHPTGYGLRITALEQCFSAPFLNRNTCYAGIVSKCYSFTSFYSW